MIEGDGKEFDYGLDVTECLAVKCFPKHDAEEFVPYLCPFDYPRSDALGLGLVRTMELAQGDEKCDFRFKWGLPRWRME